MPSDVQNRMSETDSIFLYLFSKIQNSSNHDWLTNPNKKLDELHFKPFLAGKRIRKLNAILLAV